MGLGGGRLNKTSFPSIVLVLVLLLNCYRYKFFWDESYTPTDKTQPSHRLNTHSCIHSLVN
ncbi:hypothetical protein BO83DRAFT_161104 [Aspergillus eucalypticola CBS 122712]|uniref:Uncharacterized protein n=1 Tax=Aspergillus eucalypticola (strain CBS 122712 / IBT 29274) TaxID=1448314 RepID=A0A317UQ75_ASPEC|nr:uncharacterized protein BO83DRAFT_161104 [Aspergillus eucalypticola CBS 122712]PWY63406.1 hypothetical protein BO83DRAFT_161104 [Aspergillus eucalypticola CBS 122712]